MLSNGTGTAESTEGLGPVRSRYPNGNGQYIPGHDHRAGDGYPAPEGDVSGAEAATDHRDGQGYTEKDRRVWVGENPRGPAPPPLNPARWWQQSSGHPGGPHDRRPVRDFLDDIVSGATFPDRVLLASALFSAVILGWRLVS